MPFQSIRHLPNRFLSLYLQQLEKQRQLLERVRNLLPNPLAAHLVCCVSGEKHLTLYTDSAVWASQLRFYQTAILTSITDERLGNAPLFRIKVRPDFNDFNNQSVPKARLPSTEKIDLIRRQCDHFADGELKNSMQKLCSTLSSRRRSGSIES